MFLKPIIKPLKEGGCEELHPIFIGEHGNGYNQLGEECKSIQARKQREEIHMAKGVLFWIVTFLHGE